MAPPLPDTLYHCAHCHRPIAGPSVMLNGAVFHAECTHGPSYRPDDLTRPAVRAIVQDELRRLGLTPATVGKLLERLK